MRLTISEHLSEPGTPGKANDDAFAFNVGMAVVCDGATGLGETPIFADEASDAAWLAGAAVAWFSAAAANAKVDELVRGFCTHARGRVAAATPLDALPAHAWPTSGFEMIRLVEGKLEVSGLGDCVAYVETPDGAFTRHSAMPEAWAAEMAAARALRSSVGGEAVGIEQMRAGASLDALRQARARHNTHEGGVWTLGLVPSAADHVSVLRMAATPGSRFLIMSDGFSALAEGHQRYQPKALMDAAFERGLAALTGELRHIERVEDPHGVRHPRFKCSDDSTALAGEIDA